MTGPANLRLYGFWRSMAAYRVRVALNLKGLVAEEVAVDLDAGEQFAPAFLAINPEGAVPALVVDGAAPITQSTAIMEFLEERFPLLPGDPAGRARVRSLVALVAGDTHPLLAPRVRTYLIDQFGLDGAGVRAWSFHWITRAVTALEARLATDPATGAYCHGDQPTVADLCLASLLTVRGNGYRLTDAPTVARIIAACDAHPAFQAADPLCQAGAPR